jgi:hypothetical protein
VIYRRLLGAYPPGRSPSTTTLALEKEALEQELAVGAGAAAMDAAAPAGAGLVADVLRRVLLECLPQAGTQSAGRDTAAQFEMLITRMRELEAERDDARGRAVRLAGQLQETQALLLAAQQREQAAREALAQQQAGYGRLAEALADMRRFSMQAVDAVRGETRQVRERCAYLEGLVWKKEGEVDMYRPAGAAAGRRPAARRRDAMNGLARIDDDGAGPLLVDRSPTTGPPSRSGWRPSPATATTGRGKPSTRTATTWLSCAGTASAWPAFRQGDGACGR